MRTMELRWGGAQVVTVSLVLVMALVVMPGSVALGQDRPSFIRNPAPNPVGSGARALGQGNAFIAVADDATAASWNPGGLTQLERPECSLALEFQQTDSDTVSESFPEIDVSDRLHLSDLNYASVVMPFYLGKPVVLSINYLKLYRFNKQIGGPFQPPGGVYDLRFGYTQSGEFSVVAPALAVQVTDRLSLGLTVNVWEDDITRGSRFTRTLREHGTIFGLPYRDKEYDAFTVTHGFSYVVGALVQVSNHWTVGVVYKPSYELELDHETRVQTHLGSSSATAVRRTEADLHFPTILGGGVAWQPNDSFTMSADVTWTDWSNHMLEENGKETNPVTDRPIRLEELNDTYTMRIGAEYLWIQETRIVPFRCGIGYDPSPAVDGTDNFYTASVGTGLQMGRFMFDIAYECRWGRDVNSDQLLGIDGEQDEIRHRVLASMIVYF